MVTLIQRLSQDAFRRGGGAAKLDLTPYRRFLEGLELGQGAIIALEASDHQRVVKRRLSLAAREDNFGVKWLTAAPGQLRFQLTVRKERPAAKIAALAAGSQAAAPRRGRRPTAAAAAPRQRRPRTSGA